MWPISRKAPANMRDYLGNRRKRISATDAHYERFLDEIVHISSGIFHQTSYWHPPCQASPSMQLLVSDHAHTKYKRNTKYDLYCTEDREQVAQMRCVERSEHEAKILSKRGYLVTDDGHQISDEYVQIALAEFKRLAAQGVPAYIEHDDLLGSAYASLVSVCRADAAIKPARLRIAVRHDLLDFLKTERRTHARFDRRDPVMMTRYEFESGEGDQVETDIEPPTLNEVLEDAKYEDLISDQEKDVLMLVDKRGMNQTEAGKVMEIGQQHISRIRKSGIKKLIARYRADNLKPTLDA